MLTTIINQNYFQHENQWFQPEKGIAMGSPISSIIAEIYLQYIEQTYIKHWLESEEITYYRRYVDDILIIYNINHTNEQKTAAFRYYIHRMQILPITKDAKHKEWDTILTIARNNGYPRHLINNIRTKMTNKTQNTEPRLQDKKKWITFKNFSPIVRRITNLFKDTNIKQQNNKTTANRKERKQEPKWHIQFTVQYMPGRVHRTVGKRYQHTL